MRRSALAALAALLSLMPATAPGTVQAQPASCPTQPANVFEYVDFAGPWERHGMALDVGRLGCGELSWRTYRWCPPGRSEDCDRVQDGTVRFGGLAAFALDAPRNAASTGTIASTSDPTRFAERDIVLVLGDEETLMAEWDDEAIVFCRPWRHDPLRCGA